MKVSISVMAHPSREAYVRELDRHLPLHRSIVWDRQNDRWDTGRRSILTHNHLLERHLVIQDDAIIPRGFFVALSRALAVAPPESPLVLYMTRSSVWEPTFLTIPRETSFLVMERVWWGVGIVYPTVQIPELIEFCDSLHPRQYDHAVGEFYAAEKIPVYYTWPCLLNHRRGPSLIEGRTGLRRAAKFTYRPQYLSWNGGAQWVDPPTRAVAAY